MTSRRTTFVIASLLLAIGLFVAWRSTTTGSEALAAHAATTGTPTATAKQVALPDLSVLGVTRTAVEVSPPPEHSLTVIYRVFIDGKLDNRRSSRSVQVSREPITDIISLGVLNPAATDPEPGNQIRILIPGRTPQQQWVNAGEDRDVHINASFSTTGPRAGVEETVIELAVNQPWKTESDGSRAQSSTDIHAAPIYATASYRFDPLTDEQREELRNVSRVGTWLPADDPISTE